MNKICKLCHQEPVDTMFNDLNIGNNCAHKFGIKAHVVPVRENLSSVLNSSEKFDNMFHGLAMDPHVSLKVMEKAFSPVLNEVKTKFPYLQNRTLVDSLTSPNVDDVQDFPNFVQARQTILNIVHILNKNFNLFIQEKLHEGLTLAESQICGIKTFLRLPEYKALSFSDIYTQGEVSQDQLNRVINAFQVASSLVPDKYKSVTPVPTIIIRGAEAQNSAPFASAAKQSIIVLNIQKDLIVQIAEALHEYLHLVEQFNPQINKLTNQFLLTKSLNLTPKSLEELGNKYKKPFKESAKDILVYEGCFIDLYVGRTYGDLDPSLNKLVATEVLSVGIEALLLNPTNFYMRDPEHFNLISQVLKGEI